MRDIKFRGQSINTVGGGKPIKEWVYGCLIIDESCENEYKYRIQPSKSKQLYAPAIIPETISQYTGLKDKNGAEIYEGDIVRVKAAPPFTFDYIDVIIFKNGVFGLIDKFGQIEKLPVLSLDCYEVIGNVISNPDLIKQ